MKRSYSAFGAKNPIEAVNRIIGAIFHYAEEIGVDPAECQEMYRTLANAFEDGGRIEYGHPLGEMVAAVRDAVEQADSLIIRDFLQHPGKDENGQKLPGLNDEIPEEELDTFRDEFISGDEIEEFIGDHFTNEAKKSARQAMRLRAEMTEDQLNAVDNPEHHEWGQIIKKRQAEEQDQEVVSA